MPPGAIGQQPQQMPGLFQDPSQIPEQMNQQLYRQFLGETMGFLQPLPPGSGGGVINTGQGSWMQQAQAPAGGQQKQPGQQQGQQQPRQQQQQVQQPQQQFASQPFQPMPPPMMIQPIQQPAGPYSGPMGAAPNPYMGGVGQTIGTTPNHASGYLGNVLFGG